jgi:hypothetical protein
MQSRQFVSSSLFFIPSKTNRKYILFLVSAVHFLGPWLVKIHRCIQSYDSFPGQDVDGKRLS